MNEYLFPSLAVQPSNFVILNRQVLYSCDIAKGRFEVASTADPEGYEETIVHCQGTCSPPLRPSECSKRRMRRSRGNLANACAGKPDTGHHGPRVVGAVPTFAHRTDDVSCLSPADAVA